MKEAYFKDLILSGAFDGDEDFYKLYKAYLEDEIEDEISVNMDGDWFSIRPEYAVQFLVKDRFSKAHTKEEELESKRIVIVEFEINDSIRKVPIWTSEENEDEDVLPPEWHGSALLRLRGLPLCVKHIDRKIITRCEIDTDEDGEVDAVTVEMDRLD